MKRKRTTSYEELMTGHYGKPLRPKRNRRAAVVNGKHVLSKSMDDGETVLQNKPNHAFEEYVVQSSVPDRKFEEYVVQSSAAESKYEEYIVMQSISPWQSEMSVMSSVSSQPVSVTNEYQTDLLNPLSNSSSQSILQPETFSEKSYGNNFQTESWERPSSVDSPVELSSEKSKAKPDDDDFIADMKAILSGEKAYDKDMGAVIPRNQVSNQQSAKEPPAPEAKNEHAIFDRIAQSMQYANAYDLGTVELQNRFTDFDRISEYEKRQEEERKKVKNQLRPSPEAQPLSKPDSTDFLQDLDTIRGQQKVTADEKQKTSAQSLSVPEKNTAGNAEHPPVSPGLRPYTSAERAQVFGSFPYEPDPSAFNGDGIKMLNNWKEENIVTVNIPQLNGKKIEGHTITNGSMQFHKLGADALRALWSEWESAGLLDRILTFDGSYAPRFIRHTQERNPRPLSNHSWGTAFDINASMNGFGQEPALVGQPGSVRELVEIANKHGFFWGGHFHGHKDGMHFELGKVTS